MDARARPGEELQLDLLGGLQIVDVGDVPHGFLEQLLLAVTEHAAQRVVRTQEAAFGRYDGDSDRGLREERAEQGLAVWNGGLCLPTRIRFHLASGPL